MKSRSAIHASVHRVVVTGLGAVTPIGLSVEDFWEGLMEGRSGAVRITRFDASEHRTRFACEVPGAFDPTDAMSRKQAGQLDRYAQYAFAAAREALEGAGVAPGGLSKRALDRTGVAFGSGIGGLELFEEQTLACREGGPRCISPFFVPMLIPNMAAGFIAREYGFRGPNHCVASACATGNQNLGDALLMLRHGYADAMLAGGSEACVTPMGIGGFGAMRALSTRNDDPAGASRPFDVSRDGFVLGEGAGALFLETLEHAEKRRAEPLVEVVGIGMSNDANHIAAPDPEGGGARLAMEKALRDAGLEPEAVDHVNLHATSTPAGDPAEGKALREVFGDHAPRLSLSATKSMTGHLQGGAGAVEAVACVMALRHGRVPPTINTTRVEEAWADLDFTLGGPRERPDLRVALSNAFGFGGHNATVVFRRFEAS